MKFTELLTFVKAGYKPGEIKELLEMVSKDGTGGEEPAVIPEKDQAQPDTEKPTEQPAPEDPGSDNRINELEAKITELKAQLAEAQTANTRTDISDIVPENADETLQNIVRQFM